jgi:hypothetical protein
MWCTEPGLKEALYILYIHHRTVSNTENVNILCKYLMYIMTHYGLILTKDSPDLTSERTGPSGNALARTRRNSELQTPSARQRGRYKIANRKCVKENLKEGKNWLQFPDGRLTSTLTGGHNMTFTLTLTLCPVFFFLPVF